MIKQPAERNEADITIGRTGPDWEPALGETFYAQRGSGDFAFGRTEERALYFLLKLEAEKRKAAEQDYVGKPFTVTR